jgi:hypothetical protein
VWADGFVVSAPFLDHDPGLLQGVEGLAVAHSGEPFRRTALKTWGTTENRVGDFRDGGAPFAALTQSQGAADPGIIGVSPGNVGGILGRVREG